MEEDSQRSPSTDNNFMFKAYERPVKGMEMLQPSIMAKVIALMGSTWQNDPLSLPF